MNRKSLYCPQCFRKTSLALAIAATLALPTAFAAPVGSEFQINTTTANSQRNSAVAKDADGDFVVVWDTLLIDDSGNRSLDIRAQRYNSTGVRQGAEFKVNTATSFNTLPDVAMDADGDFVVTWTRLGAEEAGEDCSIYGLSNSDVLPGAITARG